MNPFMELLKRAYYAGYEHGAIATRQDDTGFSFEEWWDWNVYRKQEKA